MVLHIEDSVSKIQVTFPQVRVGGQHATDKWAALKVSPSPNLFNKNALLDWGESVWFGNLSMEQWPVLLTCGMWPVL